MATELERLHVTILAQTQQFERALKRIERQTNATATKSSRNFRKMDRQMKTTGRAAAALATRLKATGVIMATLAVTATGKLFVGFESSMTKINALVGVNMEQVKTWTEQIKGLGPTLGKSPQELAEGMFFITSAGLRGQDALDALTAAAKASASGLGETKTIADAVTSAMNAYATSNLKAEDATGILIAAVREGKAEASEMAGVMGQVLPIASSLGVRFDEVAAALATMTRLGLNSAESITAIKSLLNALLKPSQDARKAFKEMGLEVEGLRVMLKEQGLLSVLELLRKKMAGNKDIMGRAIPNVRALTGFLGLMGENAEATKQIFESLARAGREDLNRSFEVMAQTSEFKLNKALSDLQTLLTDIGAMALPPFISFLEGVKNLFTQLSKNTEQARLELESYWEVLKDIVEHGIYATPSEILAKYDRAIGRLQYPQFPGEGMPGSLGGDLGGGGFTVKQPPPGGGAGTVAAEATNRLKEATKKTQSALDSLESTGQRVASTLSSAFADMAESGEINFKQMTSSMLSELNRLLLNKVFSAIISRGLSFFSGSVTPAGVRIPPFTTTVTPSVGRAHGGPVQAGRMYRVGEGGRGETFVPQTSGQIISGKGSMVNVNITSPPGFQGQARERQEGGVRVIDVVYAAVDKGINDGRFDRSFGQRYNARPATKRR